MATLKKMAKKQAKSLKLTRRQQWRRNPIPWAVLLIITLAIGGIWVLPNYLTWSDQKSKISNFATENQQLETRTETQKKIRNQEQEKFDQLAKGTLSVESQRFPETINTNKIAKILEIYTLQLNLSRKTYAELKTISFSTTRPSNTSDYFEMPITVSLLIDKDSFERYVEFLQTGIYDQQLTVDTISPENKGETAALEFLDNNLLPLLHIRSISFTEDGELSETFPKEVYSVQLQLSLFSQSE